MGQCFSYVADGRITAQAIVPAVWLRTMRMVPRGSEAGVWIGPRRRELAEGWAAANLLGLRAAGAACAAQNEHDLPTWLRSKSRRAE